MNFHYSNNYQLTKDDIKALRSPYLRSLVLHYSDNLNTGNVSQLAVHLEKQDKQFGKIETYHDIKTNARVTTYQGSRSVSSYSGHVVDSCCAVVYCYPDSPHGDSCATLAAFVREGDILTADWMRSGGNGYLESALCNDKQTQTYNAPLFDCTVAVLVHRGDKTYKFILESSITPDNSAIMIKYH